jgi:hypothetical protein
VENKKCFDTVDARYKHEDFRITLSFLLVFIILFATLVNIINFQNVQIISINAVFLAQIILNSQVPMCVYVCVRAFVRVRAHVCFSVCIIIFISFQYC